MNWPFGNFRPMNYQLIMADPAWQFSLRSKKGEKKSPQKHYQCMPLADIQALPVDQLAGRDCILILWATAPMLPQAIETMERWHFTYVTAGAWVKTTGKGKICFGTGYVLRSAAEFFLLGKMGSPVIGSRSERNLILDDDMVEAIRNGMEFECNALPSPRREHSRKPDKIFELGEALCPHAFKIELFSRQERPGWDTWGNEVHKFAPINQLPERQAETEKGPLL